MSVTKIIEPVLSFCLLMVYREVFFHQFLHFWKQVVIYNSVIWLDETQLCWTCSGLIIRSTWIRFPPSPQVYCSVLGVLCYVFSLLMAYRFVLCPQMQTIVRHYYTQVMVTAFHSYSSIFILLSSLAFCFCSLVY